MSDFKIEKILGKGSFGNVYLVTRKKDKKIYALKTVILEKLNKKEQENSVNEVRILASVNHPNVIGYKEAFWNDKESSLNIVMEYADDGDLQTKIQKMKKDGGMFNESLIWSYSIQMIEGLKALHDKKIMHRDLKSANIFLVKEKHQCKLGDMNVSKVIKDKVLFTQTGTPYYASPEVWNDKPYSYKSDLWSIGCVIYELCALHPPFNGKDLDELYINVCKGKVERINKIYSDDLWKMILMLLQVDVKKRVDCDSFLNSELIMKKKKEMKEFNYFDNNINENINNGILLNTIKFSNINEIKAQLPRNKNYNDEQIYNKINIINNKNDTNDLNNINFFSNINNQLSHRSNSKGNSKKGTNIINKNNIINSNNNDFIQSLADVLSINNKNDNNNNNIFEPNRNIICDKNENNDLNIININNKSSEREKYMKKKIKNNKNINYSSKEKKTNKKNYNDLINYHTENEEKEEKRKKIEKEKEKLLKEIEYNKYLEQLKIQKEIQKIKDAENEIRKRNNLREILNTPHIPHIFSDLSSNIKHNNNKERVKTEELTENYKKIQKTIRYNPIDLIPTSIKKSKTNRLEIEKIKNNKSIDNYLKKVKNNSYTKKREPKSSKKNKNGIPIYKNISKENRTKTPIMHDKNNTRLQSDNIDNYNYYYYKNYNRLKRKEYSENQKSLGFINFNQKPNITDINNKIENYKIKKVSKSNTNINLNPNIMDNYIINNKLSNKKLNSYKKISNITKIRPSSVASKRIKDFNNKSNNILNYNYIQTTQKSKNDKQNISFNFLDNNNNHRKIKTFGNNSSININFNNLIPNNTKIKHKSTYTINNNNNFYKENIRTTVENSNDIFNQKKLYIDNKYINKKKAGNSYDKNIKKINNNKIKHYTCKRTTVDDKRIKERKKIDSKSNRDLTEPELLMILNPIKIKDNYKNNNNNLNFTLNDNINQNQFLTKIKQSKNVSNNNPNPSSNQYYSNNINSVNIINNNGNIENNNTYNSNGPQIFNNFYSINNLGNCKIPVKLINVFN